MTNWFLGRALAEEAEAENAPWSFLGEGVTFWVTVAVLLVVGVAVYLVARKKGSKTTFLPDKRVFEDTVFNHDTVDRRLRELAYLNRGVKIVFTDERIKEPEKSEREILIERMNEIQKEIDRANYARSEEEKAFSDAAEEQEELRKKEERKDRLHQNYLKRKASGAQKQYEDKIKAKKKAEMDAKKALIRAEDMKKGVFSTIGQLPKEEPRKGSIAASAAV